VRVLFVSPMAYGSNQAVDALGHGLESRLAADGIETRLAFPDFRSEHWIDGYARAIRAGADAGVDAIAVWVVDAGEPAEAVAYARGKGVPVVTLEKPRFPVDASVVYPNFNHGVYMAEALAGMLHPGAEVAVVGGPDVVDDIELLLGITHGVQWAGLRLVNDPEDPRYKNITDVAEGGREKTSNILSDFPKLDGLIPYNDETMLGAVQALEEAGRLGEVRMVSRNGTPKAVDLIRRGVHHGTWDPDIPGIGTTLGDLLARHLVHGEPLDGQVFVSPIGRMITAETIDAWVPWEQRVTYNELEEFEA
jgi:ABC-type sugar transport system substrate-binding protein